MIGITTDIDGDYLRLKHQYCSAVEGAGGIPLLLSPAADAGEYAAIINGLLIPGGNDLDPAYYNEGMHRRVKPVPRERSDFEISLLSIIIGMKKPVLGICYGMQLLNVFFGGSLYRDLSLCPHVAINHEKDYHRIVITENRFLAHGAFSVNSSHHQAIMALGRGLSAIAYSDDQIIEAIFKEDHPFIVGVQWHPERTLEDRLSRDIFHRFIKAAYTA